MEHSRRPVTRQRFIRITAVIVLLTGTVAVAQSTFQPIATVRELMERIIVPTSDMVFGVAGEAPKDGEGWTALGNSALTLAESGNLLLMSTPSGDKGVWSEQSKALRAAAAAAYKAANAKDADAVIEAGDKIYETCAGCHEQYLKGN